MSHRPTTLLLCLLASVAACASQPAKAPKTAVGYDLRIEGTQVSLTFERGLTVAEFLAMAQQVTNARYLYNAQQIAGTGPVTLLGQFCCEKSKFADFVDLQLGLHGLKAEVRGSGDSQYVEVALPPKG